MTGFLPEGVRCSAYWYAWRASMLTGDGDLDFLRYLGLRAWHLARWHRVPEWPKIREGPYWVHLWPEWVWDVASRQMAEDAARFGDWETPGSGYWERGDYG